MFRKLNENVFNVLPDIMQRLESTNLVLTAVNGMKIFCGGLLKRWAGTLCTPCISSFSSSSISSFLSLSYMPLADNSLIRFSLLRHLEGAYWILRGNFVFQVDLSGSYFIDLLETYVGEKITGDFNKLNLDPLCRQFGLRKCVKSPTRGNAILDQILTNMSHLFEPAQHLPPLGRSDHQCLLFNSFSSGDKFHIFHSIASEI